MECPNCKTELRWESDVDSEDEDAQKYIESYWSCDEERGGCKTFVVIFTPID